MIRRSEERKLITDQIQLLLQVFENSDLTTKEISAKKGLVLCKARFLFLVGKNYLKFNRNERNTFLLKINKYCKTSNHAFTARNVTDYVNEKLN